MRRLHRASLIVALAAAVFGAAGIKVPPALAVDPTVVVRAGDTLTGIAAANGMTVDRLAAVNGITDPMRIYAGQVLVVEAVSSGPVAGASPPRSANRHAVAPGETLTAIAARYGTTVGELAAANHLADPSFILAGQILDVPGTPRQSPASHPGWVAITVRPGDTLTAIGAAHGSSVGELAAANHLADASLIFAGTQLLVPGPQTTAARTPAAAFAGSPATAAAVPTPAPPSAPATTSAPSARAVENGSASGSSAGMPDWMLTLTTARSDVRALVERQAVEFGVPVPFALAVAWQESGWQQSVVSSSGAIGVMQLLPDTAAWVGEAMLGEPVDVYDATSNVRAGVRLLRHYLDRYDGNRELTLAAYFQGERATDERGVFAGSVPYITSILYHERFFGG